MDMSNVSDMLSRHTFLKAGVTIGGTSADGNAMVASRFGAGAGLGLTVGLD